MHNIEGLRGYKKKMQSNKESAIFSTMIIKECKGTAYKHKNIINGSLLKRVDN